MRLCDPASLQSSPWFLCYSFFLVLTPILCFKKGTLTACILYPPFPPKCLFNGLYYWQALVFTLPSTLLAPTLPPSFFFLTKQIRLWFFFFFFFLRGKCTQDCSVAIPPSVSAVSVIFLTFYFILEYS